MTSAAVPIGRNDDPISTTTAAAGRPGRHDLGGALQRRLAEDRGRQVAARAVEQLLDG